ncbi:ATP-binding protein [Bacillus altitudinis]|uniref:AAA family ATPase n=1 Tax=Bacillus altitudinis TaxID=293387 RepID=UPI0022805D79|nr:AAA family ATPase [Bacillus altitudinis]MCY7451653.1 ATP-binding protein [Bacillus altitudinis]MCY7695767.1 ATP-binding protein [Bacillus altitudinis]
MEELNDLYVHLVRLALEKRQQDIVTLVKRNIKQFSDTQPKLVNGLKEELSNYESRSNIIRKASQSNPLPIDIDSKLELVKKEYITFENKPLWPKEISDQLSRVVKEREFEQKLIKEGLTPTRTILFVGAPGVGKTLAAKWISSVLDKPILTLDLAAVMSSYLGKTGNNIRAVLEYAKNNDCILLLDEFDAIAKKRGDDSELGELKRLVTVLLQEIDEWPETGLLIAATNHEELLDRAVWRRFERVIKFPIPSMEDISYTIKNLLENDSFEDKDTIVNILSLLFEGNSYANITKEINNARKDSIIQGIHIKKVLEEIINKLCLKIEKRDRINIALNFLNAGYSQRRTAEIFGLSRDTIRKYAKKV